MARVYVDFCRKPIFLDTDFGAAVMEAAQKWQVNPFDLQDAATAICQEERYSLAEIVRARQAARHATGLTYHHISALEDAGKDHTAVARLDVLARELAGEYPELGIGRRFSLDEAYDDTDHAALLWELLRQPDPAPRSRRSESVIRQAAEMIALSKDEEVPF